MKNFCFFDYLLMAVGLVIAVAGFFWIRSLEDGNGMQWDTLQTTFLWFILMAQMVMIGILESIRKDMKKK